jgi:hypothetical protein
MPRRNYNKRAGRNRPQGQRSDFEWLVDLLRARHEPTSHQTPGEPRRHTKENR